MKKATLKVDLDALLYNYRHIKCTYNKDVIAVIKDNAYSMGLIEIAKFLQNEKNIIFAVSSMEEVILLRNNNISCPILYLNVFDEEDLEDIKKYNVTVIVQSKKQLRLLKNSQIEFHIKINSGMNRLGLYDYELNDVIKEINSNKSYNIKGIMTHFADDDKDHCSYYKFEKIVSKINRGGLIIHCFASSSLSNNFPNISTHVRVGIKLFGIGERNMFLENVISISSPILQIKRIKSKQKIGYDKSFTSPCNGFLYILPVGYGQGYGDFINSFGYVNGVFIRQAGKISMDYSTYFSSELLDENMQIELIGKHISIEQLCKINNIKPHEFLVKLKLPIEYIKK